MAPKKQYSKEQMAAALQAVERGMSVYAASKQFNVPRVTLLYKSTGKSPKDCTMGPPTMLTAEEEDALCEWIFALAQHHYPMSKEQLLDSVEYIVKETKRDNKFTNNRPGHKWYSLFLKRHPEISLRVSQNLTAARENVTEAQIRNWFAEIKKYLVDKKLFDIAMNNPDRVFNADEAAFFMQPKGEKVLAKKGERSIHTATNNDEKENLTVLVTANAAGTFAPPMIVFSYERVPSHISNSVPPSWGIGRSESGWMCGPTFFEYKTNVFLPWLQESNIERPILFFVDGHVSHMTMHLSLFCSRNGIELFALYPNSTHLIQPMDVAVFRPLKAFWKKEVKKWRMQNAGNKMQKQHFATIFKEALASITEDTLRNGFRVCGLVPFNVENVNFTKISAGKKQNDTSKNAVTKCKSSLLNELEKRIGENKVKIFEDSVNKEDWDGALEDTSLFQIWKGIKTESSVTIIPEKNNEDCEGEKSKIQESEDMQTRISQLECTPLKENQVDNTESDSINIFEPSTSKSAGELLKSKSQINHNAFNIPENVPSPFKRALIELWPENSISSQQNKKRKSKEKIPSVVTSAAWQEYHLKKENEKKEKQKQREQRAKNRDKKKQELEKKKLPIVSESSDEEEDWVESGDSMDDVSVYEELDFCKPTQIGRVKDISIGDYLLVKFPGGKRQATFYRYVCVVQNIFLSEQEVEVLCMNLTDEDKTTFKANESDVSVVRLTAILGKLPPPEILMAGDRLKYKFPEPIDVFEST